ncbi:MAG: hypothetical protein JJ909_00720 [Roseivirga sp.]|uniref:hypothetical protein n=1 Tax=Roseivirga sp. TaxID=1964215 RepID=UPI001AFF30EE|nr:hypothetical protein [Roseivirga sp.]MBO6659169.1 hypothetical protein [Roseivirga sp.]MBO6759484.1 hypothetical protein [Roseivirga sp.]MBO6908094.1 hypothetical protein [Roseivirga sp.]
MFIIGQLAILTSVFIKKLIERKSTRTLYRQIIKETIKKTKVQEKVFLKNIENLTFENLRLLTQNRIEYYQLEIIKEVGYQKFYSSFFSGLENIPRLFNRAKKLKAFIRSWEILNQIEFIRNQGYEKITFMGDKYNQHDLERSKVLKEFRRYTDSLALKVNGKHFDPLTHQYLDSLFTTIGLWQQTMDRRPHIVNRKLIVPIRILNRKHQNLNWSSEINDLLIEASYRYENMSHVLKTGRRQYSIYVASSRYFHRTLALIKENL